MRVLLVVLLCLATYRVTRLVVEDQLPLVKTPRDALANWLDPWNDPKLIRRLGAESVQRFSRRPLGAFGASLAYLVTCPWCMGVWVGAALVFTTDAWFADVPYPWLTWAAAAAAAGLLTSWEGK